MTNNITVPGQGSVLATDEINSIHWPKSKTAYGDDGAATVVSSSHRLPVSSMGIYERMMIEGEPWGASGFNATAVNVAAGAINQSMSGPAFPSIGKTAWIESVTLSYNVPVLAQIQLADAATRYTNLLQNCMVGKEGLTILFRGFVRPFMYSATQLSVSIRRVFDKDGAAAAGATDVYGGCSATGYIMTDDFDFDADKTIVFFMDSIGNGTGPTATSKMWPWLVKAHILSAQGVRARVLLKSNSGSTTSDHELWRVAGRYTPINADVGVYAVSVNDAATATATATTIANVTAFWNWWSKRYPNKLLIICGTTPLENNTWEAAAVAYRAAALAYVAGVGSSYLKYIELGSSFDRTSGTTNYAASDSAGSRIHPNDTGHAAVAVAFNAAYDSQGIVI